MCNIMYNIGQDGSLAGVVKKTTCKNLYTLLLKLILLYVGTSIDK